ncbi:MAG: hypothetical protein EZS28_025443, partial [Streblomastix strix]
MTDNTVFVTQEQRQIASRESQTGLGALETEIDENDIDDFLKSHEGNLRHVQDAANDKEKEEAKRQLGIFIKDLQNKYFEGERLVVMPKNLDETISRAVSEGAVGGDSYRLRADLLMLLDPKLFEGEKGRQARIAVREISEQDIRLAETTNREQQLIKDLASRAKKQQLEEQRINKEIELRQKASIEA